MNKVLKLRLLKYLGVLMLLAIPLTLFMAIKDSNTALYIVSGVLLIVGLMLTGSAGDQINKTCEYCGASMSGAKHSFRKTMEKTDHRGDIKVSIEFKATCPSCQREKIIKKDYEGYRAPIYDNKSGEITREERYFDVDTAVKADANRFFG